MRLLAVGVAGSVIASAIFYLVLAATGTLSSGLRLAVVSLVLLLGVIAAWLAVRRARNEIGGATVGSRIDSEGDITVEHIEIENAGGARVGTDLKAGGTSRIRDVRVTRGRGSD